VLGRLGRYSEAQAAALHAAATATDQPERAEAQRFLEFLERAGAHDEAAASAALAAGGTAAPVEASHLPRP
jgi:hypothetical protein